MTDTREAFEKWMKSKNPKYKATDDSVGDRILWECAQYFWQAGAQHSAISKSDITAAPGELCPACAASEFERVSGFGELK